MCNESYFQTFAYNIESHWWHRPITKFSQACINQHGICNSPTGSLLDLAGKGVGSLCDMFLGKTLQSH